jgi:hypothetical protein
MNSDSKVELEWGDLGGYEIKNGENPKVK